MNADVEAHNYLDGGTFDEAFGYEFDLATNPRPEPTWREIFAATVLSARTAVEGVVLKFTGCRMRRADWIALAGVTPVAVFIACQLVRAFVAVAQ